MWFFCSKRFLSIVECQDNKMFLLVRSRLKGDIERIFPGAVVEEEAGSDYRFRCFLPRAVAAKTLAKEIAAIDYSNYKAAILDHERREQAYYEIWLRMYRLQEESLRAEQLALDNGVGPLNGHTHVDPKAG
jgi:hypothetical protein